MTQIEQSDGIGVDVQIFQVFVIVQRYLFGKTRDKKPFLMGLAEKAFSPTLNMALKAKKLVLGIGIASIVAGVFLFSRLGAEFIPQLDEGDFALQFIRPANISMENSVKLQRLSEKIVLGFPQVKDVFARTGAAEVATDPMGVNISDSYVMLKNKEKWPKDNIITDKKSLMKAVKEKLDLHVPGQVMLVSQPVVTGGLLARFFRVVFLVVCLAIITPIRTIIGRAYIYIDGSCSGRLIRKFHIM